MSKVGTLRGQMKKTFSIAKGHVCERRVELGSGDERACRPASIRSRSHKEVKVLGELLFCPVEKLLAPVIFSIMIQPEVNFTCCVMHNRVELKIHSVLATRAHPLKISRFSELTRSKPANVELGDLVRLVAARDVELNIYVVPIGVRLK